MNEDYEIPKITEIDGGMVYISPQWTWVYADFDGEPRWLMTPDIKPFSCPNLLFVENHDSISLYASTYFNTPTELWSKFQEYMTTADSTAAVEAAFPQIAAEYRESLATIPLWKAQDPRFSTKKDPAP